MNEEPTSDLPNRGSFEERVFARFDAVDARFDTVDVRLEKLEARGFDTKPIWEKALAQIMETGLEVGGIKAKVGVIEGKVGIIESKVGVIESKVGVIESKVGVVEGKVGMIETDLAALKINHTDVKSELIDLRREKHQVNKRLDLILEFLLEDRGDIRDARDRISKLETKLA